MAECTVSQAAAALGVSVASIRRGIKTGRYPARRQPTVQGYTWLVSLPSAPDSRVAAARVPDGRVPDSRVPAQDGPTPTTTAILATRAQEMAQYTRELLAPLHARLEAQAERIGRLEAELAQARGAQTQSAPSPVWEARRWWQRLLWG
jgi:hypothetical protein